jgi:D-inositol-3-phosphate glycosyltransferase
MISFVWPPGPPMLAGTGGSETYTAGHARELLRRGVKTQVVTIGQGVHDGRKDFPDIPFLSLNDESQISDLPGTVVFVNGIYPVKTKQKAAVILHCVTPHISLRPVFRAGIVGKTIIATSIYSAQQWALYLDVPYSRINIALPFADPVFGGIKRGNTSKKTRLVFAGRLHPDKGIYTLLETMHNKIMRKNGHIVTIVAAGLHVEAGQTIERMLHDYPYARLVTAQKTVANMANLLAVSDILLMPSVYAEPFGMLSIEAQHAGCRVVASNIGGLPETNCGLLTLVEPRDPEALLVGIEQAVALGMATKKEREIAKDYFTLGKSVDSLLSFLHL